MDSESLQLLQHGLQQLLEWQHGYGPFKPDASLQPAAGKAGAAIDALCKRLQGNYPFHHPSYAGQMLKPPHPVAWAAYALAMSINPNNHALDGGPPTSQMEKEVVADLARMFGYGEHLGHLTGGGTLANLEALWVAKCLHPGKFIAYGANAHYTHKRMCEVMGITSVRIATDEHGRMDLKALEGQLRNLGTVVVTMGSTGLGLVEPLKDIIAMCKPKGIRVHVDAAYGGFFKLLTETGLINDEHWMALADSDSIVVDPHKHGLQPYGCGCVVFRDPTVGRFYKHDSPYTYFSSDELHLGEISLECSRPGAAAAALWTTLQVLPLSVNGLGAVLAKTRRAALAFYEHIKFSQLYKPLTAPELDIVAYFARHARSLSELSAASQRVFDAGMQAPKDQGFHLSLYTVKSEFFKHHHPNIERDQEEGVVLRSVLMKPEHNTFVTELIQRLDAIGAQVI
jgi:glutamate/tyrosine decarboxylase-like PLP-dependent enzyme